MFEAIIGHAAPCEFLRRSFASERLAHAYLFVGPARVGKMAVARAFAEAFVGSTNLEVNPDVTIVTRLTDEKTDALKSSISVEQIRALRERLSFSSLLPSGKLAIVDDAHTMTIEAANALLKTLEEPRGRTIIILIASDLRTVPETVRSRSQLIRFGLVHRRALEEGLGKRGVVARDASRFSRIAMGRPGIAISFQKDPDAFAALTSVMAERELLRSKPVYEQLAWVESESKRFTHERVVEELMHFRELTRDALLTSLGLARFTRNPDAVMSVENDADHTAQLVGTLRRIRESEESIRQHGDGRLALEHVMIS